MDSHQITTNHLKKTKTKKKQWYYASCNTENKQTNRWQDKLKESPWRRLSSILLCTPHPEGRGCPTLPRWDWCKAGCHRSQSGSMESPPSCTPLVPVWRHAGGINKDSASHAMLLLENKAYKTIKVPGWIAVGVSHWHSWYKTVQSYWYQMFQTCGKKIWKNKRTK